MQAPIFAAIPSLRREFGNRKVHYCFSKDGRRDNSDPSVTEISFRYGLKPDFFASMTCVPGGNVKRVGGLPTNEPSAKTSKLLSSAVTFTTPVCATAAFEIPFGDTGAGAFVPELGLNSCASRWASAICSVVIKVATF